MFPFKPFIACRTDEDCRIFSCVQFLQQSRNSLLVCIFHINLILKHGLCLRIVQVRIHIGPYNLTAYCCRLFTDKISLDYELVILRDFLYLSDIAQEAQSIRQVPGSHSEYSYEQKSHHGCADFPTFLSVKAVHNGHNKQRRQCQQNHANPEVFCRQHIKPRKKHHKCHGQKGIYN